MDADASSAERRGTELLNAPGDGRVVTLGVDIGDPKTAKEVVESISKELGGLATTVHSAATREPTATAEDMEIKHWDEALRVNLTSMFLLCKFAIPHLRAAGGGVIINIASQLGSVVTPGRPAYHATKGAVIQFTKAIAIENAQDNIRAVSISPGAIITEIFGVGQKLSGEKLSSSEHHLKSSEAFNDFQPIPRAGLPEDIANLALYLASDESTFVTGQDFVVDGGLLAGRPLNIASDSFKKINQSLKSF